MTPLLYISLALITLAAVGYGSWLLFLANRFRGVRVITCPENHQSAAVNLDMKKILTVMPFDDPDLRLNSCTRWPEREGCGQACLSQIEHAPDGCRAKTILTDWYLEKSCAVCGKPFEAIQWVDHRPGLMAPAGDVVEWKEIHPENIPETLRTHRPVCWNCFIAEAFRQRYPELVTDRMVHR